MVIQAVAEIEVRVEDYSQAVMVVAFNARVVRPFNTSRLNTSLRFHSSRAASEIPRILNLTCVLECLCCTL